MLVEAGAGSLKETIITRELLDQALHRRREPDAYGNAGRIPAKLSRIGHCVAERTWVRSVGTGCRRAVIAIHLDKYRMHVELEMGESVGDRRERGGGGGTDAEA